MIAIGVILISIGNQYWLQDGPRWALIRVFRELYRVITQAHSKRYLDTVVRLAGKLAPPPLLFVFRRLSRPRCSQNNRLWGFLLACLGPLFGLSWVCLVLSCTSLKLDLAVLVLP